MKKLILTLSLLFLTGTHGRFLWQSDEPSNAEDNVADTISAVVDKAVQFGEDAVKTLESADIVKEYNVKERSAHFRARAGQAHHTIREFSASLREQLDKDLHEHYPVLTEKALPIIKEFFQHLKEYFHGVKKEAFALTGDYLVHVNKDTIDFIDKLKPLGEGVRDKVRSEVETLRAKISPLEKDLRDEIERNQHKAY